MVGTRRHPPDFLPPDVRDHPEVRRACHDWEIGRLFRIVQNLTEGPERFTAAHLARRCDMTASRALDYMNGTVHARQVTLIARVADGLHIPGAYFGLPERPWESQVSRSTGTKSPAEASQEQWRAARDYLYHHADEIQALSTRLYPAEWHIAGTRLLAHPDWLPTKPVELNEIALKMDESARAPMVNGTEPEARAVLPLRAPGAQFDRYTSAIRYLDPPTLFENRPSYRLLGMSWGLDTATELTFGMTTYFDKLDVTEPLVHEFALASMRHPGADEIPLHDLPFRALVGDPFDLKRRPVAPGITTLTIRRDTSTDQASFLLHWRDPAKVAVAGDMYDVVPAGEFQPSSVNHWDRSNDFDLWRNIVRELSEELLGTPEHDGSGGVPIDYDAWPLYRALTQARHDGRVRVYCLGIGVDALGLAVTIPTVLVIDDDLFDDLLGQLVTDNAEGRVIATHRGALKGIPWTESAVEHYLAGGRMSPSGAACLSLAWHHRNQLWK